MNKFERYCGFGMFILCLFILVLLLFQIPHAEKGINPIVNVLTGVTVILMLIYMLLFRVFRMLSEPKMPGWLKQVIFVVVMIVIIILIWYAIVVIGYRW
ncbi:MAG: hypothetical protein ACP5OA_05245 [Candidatus Woesearchaeota archaeon]